LVGRSKETAQISTTDGATIVDAHAMTTSLKNVKDEDRNETIEKEMVSETIHGVVEVTPLNGQQYLSF